MAWIYGLDSPVTLDSGDAGSCTQTPKTKRVGGFNPVEKYACQNGNLPQVGVKIENI